MAPVLADTAASPRLRWGDLRLRVLSAAVLVPVALGCLWLGGWPWRALVALAALGLAVEWIGLCRRRPGRLLLPAGAIYILPAVAALLWLRADPVAGRPNVWILLFIVWASDIGAYVAGRLVGGPRLAPAISPGKTWSGAAGGLAAAILVGVLAGPGWPAAAVAAVLGVTSQAGDLLESGLKRYFGVKDSGRLIPGHGGLLDRLDGLLTAAPMAALLAAALGHGVEMWR